jgi:hypothetical protein
LVSDIRARLRLAAAKNVSVSVLVVTQVITFYRKLHIFVEILWRRYFACSGDKIERNEMGEAYSAYGEEERHIQGLGGET